MMAQSSYRVRCIGDYVIGKQIGSGSYSVVWHGRHKVHGTEVAIKEIHSGRLNKKLEECLMSEIEIMKNINHPNIIRLHGMIKEPGKIHLVLEYCKGGDLSMFIQRRQGRIPESTAMHFMQQLAAGLKILRENQIIHRDLKPQNLLLSANEDNSTLKIADFGFARCLQPRGLAETLCGSPLYMAPEIMQLQKYDAKADLWSVGAILFQVVTGRTPFTGINQVQLLQNIMKSAELQFPPNVKDLSSECMDLCRKLLRQSPVERLSFEEFFSHSFFTRMQPVELSRNMRPHRLIDGFIAPEHTAIKKKEETFQDDNLPFSLDDDISGPDGSPTSIQRSTLRSTYGSNLNTVMDRGEMSDDMDISLKYSTIRHKPENAGFETSNGRSAEGYLQESLISTNHRPVNIRSNVVDSLELVDQEYVLVYGPLGDASCTSATVSKLSQLASKSESPPQSYRNVRSAVERNSWHPGTCSTSLSIVGGATSKIDCNESLESQCTAPSRTLCSSDGIVDASKQSTDLIAVIKSLQHSASAIKELVYAKIEAGQQLEAFSIQLVILAIWKQALHICHTHVASAIEGSPCKETMMLKETTSKDHDSLGIQECLVTATSPQDACCLIERVFLGEVENAEEIAKVIEPGNVGMPDAMETIFQAALTFGKHGAVDECMGYVESAASLYSKAVCLLKFLLVEAPSLVLNPPFSITNSDSYRLTTYVDVLDNRERYSRSQRMALFDGDDQPCHSG